MPEPEKEKEQLSNVTVTLDEKNQPVKVEEKKEEPKYVTADILATTLQEAIKKATAPLYYEMRQSRENQKPPQPVQQPPKPEPTEWDAKLQKDWKGTVEELAEARVNDILQKREALQRAEYENQQYKIESLNNQKTVMAKHPELNDEDSIKTQTYRQILQEKPQYLNNVYGPILAMRDMEDKLRESGVVDNATKQVVDKEIARQVRTNGGIIPKGSPVSGKKSITLTKEQKELCDHNGWKYENYAKYAAMNDRREGVEV